MILFGGFLIQIDELSSPMELLNEVFVFFVSHLLHVEGNRNVLKRVDVLGLEVVLNQGNLYFEVHEEGLLVG